MKIAGSDLSNIQTTQTTVMTAQPSKLVLSGSSDGTAPANSSRISISGMALLLSRQFGTDDLAAEPGIETRVDKVGLAMNPVYFLTKNDRASLAEIYQYAQEQSADLKYVDRIAFDLGRYRQQGDGRIMTNLNNGTMFDAEGRAQTFSFTEKDAATAERILNSDTINSTKLDRGFLAYILDPGFGVTHVSDFGFMEQMVNKLSNTNSTLESLSPQFSTFTENEKKNYIIHTSEDATLRMPHSDEAGVPTSQIALNNIDLQFPHSENVALKILLENHERPQGMLSSLFEMLRNLGITNQK